MDKDQLHNQLLVMKKPLELQKIHKDKLVGNNNEISLFELSRDKPLEPKDAPFIKEQLKSFLTIDKNESQTNTLVVKLFIESLYEQRMGKKQFIRALKEAFKTKTYGNKDFLSHVLSYDKTIKTYTYNGVLKLINQNEIERFNEVVHVEFINGRDAYIHKSDYVPELMNVYQYKETNKKSKRYYTDTSTGETYEV